MKTIAIKEDVREKPRTGYLYFTVLYKKLCKSNNGGRFSSSI